MRRWDGWIRLSPIFARHLGSRQVWKVRRKALRGSPSSSSGPKFGEEPGMNMLGMDMKDGHEAERPLDPGVNAAPISNPSSNLKGEAACTSLFSRSSLLGPLVWQLQ